MEILTAIELLDPDMLGCVPQHSGELIQAKRVAVRVMKETLERNSPKPMTLNEFSSLVREYYEDYPLFIADLSDPKSRIGYWIVPRFFDRAEGGSDVIVFDGFGTNRRMLFIDEHKKKWVAYRCKPDEFRVI